MSATAWSCDSCMASRLFPFHSNRFITVSTSDQASSFLAPPVKDLSLRRASLRSLCRSKTLLERTGNTDASGAEDILPALRRSLLESQWAAHYLQHIGESMDCAVQAHDVATLEESRAAHECSWQQHRSRTRPCVEGSRGIVNSTESSVWQHSVHIARLEELLGTDQSELGTGQSELPESGTSCIHQQRLSEGSCSDHSWTVDQPLKISTCSEASIKLYNSERMPIVKSGQPSARQRRLRGRTRTKLVANVKSEIQATESCRTELDDMLVHPHNRRRRKNDAKLEPVRSFVSLFLRPTDSCKILSKKEEQVFTKQIRIFQSLKKAKQKLQRELGYEPSLEFWAQYVRLSTGELLLKMAEGERARNTMLKAHLRLVISIAKGHQHFGLDMDDLIQEGSKGLLLGLEKFDHTKGYKLSTYVYWWIRQGMISAIAQNSRLIRIPKYVHEILFLVKKGEAELSLEGKPATSDNLSEVLEISRVRLERALQARNRVLSIDKPVTSYGLKREFNGMHEIIPDMENQPMDLLCEEQMKLDVKKRMANLTPRELMIIRWYYGFDTQEGTYTSSAAIGNRLGISKGQVNKIKRSAIKKMQVEIEDDSIIHDFLRCQHHRGEFSAGL